MARRRQPPQDQREQPRLTASRETVEAELRDRLSRGEDILEAALSAENPTRLSEIQADYQNWSEYNQRLLKRRFTTEEIADTYSRGGPAARVVSVGYKPDFQERRDSFVGRIEARIRRLQSTLVQLELFEEPESPREAVARSAPPSERKTIFIVHGHDQETKLEVHGFLRDVTSLKAVILHDQPNAGRTIIEKFEDHAADAAFAVVILTGDDIGCAVTPEPKLQPRARQNVVFEFGFFVAAIGRNRVAILYEEGVERPSDVDGVAYIPLEEEWKIKLARELNAAEIDVDTDKLI